MGINCEPLVINKVYFRALLSVMFCGMKQPAGRVASQPGSRPGGQPAVQVASQPSCWPGGLPARQLGGSSPAALPMCFSTLPFARSQSCRRQPGWHLGDGGQSCSLACSRPLDRDRNHLHSVLACHRCHACCIVTWGHIWPRQ